MHPFCSSFGLSHAHQLNKSRFDLTDLPIYLSAPVHPSRVGEPKICTRIASHALSRGVGSLIQNARQASNIGRDDFTQSQIEAPVPTTKAHQSSSKLIMSCAEITGEMWHLWSISQLTIKLHKYIQVSNIAVKYQMCQVLMSFNLFLIKRTRVARSRSSAICLTWSTACCHCPHRPYTWQVTRTFWNTE